MNVDRGGVEIRLQRRQRDVDDRAVDKCHARGQNGRSENPAATRLCTCRSFRARTDYIFIARLSKHRRLASVFAERFVGIAIQPALARLRGSDHRMSGRVRVFARVTIRRAVAAQRRAAYLAGSQMNPTRADLRTLGALAGFRLLDRID